MKQDYTDLTVNPCKMCMPMGVVNALYGIKGCMTILHGSQGCSTYIRRHMATHYNEPIDIASSSLTEEGTVYGGEKNLIKGLENLIELYNPEVIGISTTCLAETIGEDIAGMVKTFEENHKKSGVKLIPISSPGYGGTQYDGYFKALKCIVENVNMSNIKNKKINVVAGPISPADVRELKEILDSFELDYILLPDISENLDGEHLEEYNRLPSSGTDINDVKYMGGAIGTIELSTFVRKEHSVGIYLEEKFGVKNYPTNLPRGIRDTDNFLNLLSKLSNKDIPIKYKKERGRYLDAMIDSHKYNAEGRIAIFGEPDLVYSTSRMCIENGVVPVLIASGEKCNDLEEKLRAEVDELSDKLFSEKCKIMDKADFKDIEKYVLKLEANIILGSSDGRRIEEKTKIPLVRIGFPIHDRVGGQRIITIGYRGSLNLSDEITNNILKIKEEKFRDEIYEKFYKDDKRKLTVVKKDKHPCFSCDSSHKYARIHLPVAPKCNISCNYCLRKFDCVNESRPGVTTEVLSPREALLRYKEAKEVMPNLSVVGIAGPGDALANFEETKETLSLIREYDKDVTFCLSTNGLMLPFYAQELIDLGVSHVTITINAIDPKITAGIYKYINYLGTTYIGEDGAKILLNNQLLGLKYLTDRGITVKVNIVMLKGINDKHIYDITKKVKELGATITNIMQMIPVKGSIFEDMPLVSNKEIMEIRKKCGENIEQMYHCKQCRADAIGLLGEDISSVFRDSTKKENKEDNEKGLKFAVASKSGIIVDSHFGHADEFHIYEYKKEEVLYRGKRKVDKYCNGIDMCDEEIDKFERILRVINDCDGIICIRVGDEPSRKLKAIGKEVFMTCERIEDAVSSAAKLMIKEDKVENNIRV